MVLDSTVDPTGVWYADNIGQDYAFQGRQDAFYSWVAAHSAMYGLGTTRAQVSQAWYQADGAAAAHPVRISGRQALGPDEFRTRSSSGGTRTASGRGSPRRWPATCIRAMRPGWFPAYQQQGVQGENEFAVYNAVECSDVNWPRSWARWDADTRKVYSTAPFEAWGNAWFNAACAFWPVHGPASPLRIGAEGLPGILMLQGTLDAATPYAGAQRAHKALPTARMVVVVGGGNHGQSLASPPNACVNGYLNRYLATGALPRQAGAGQRHLPGAAPAFAELTQRQARCWRMARHAAGAGPAGGACQRRLAACRYAWECAAHKDVEIVIAAPADDSDRDEALLICDRDPVTNVFVSARLRSAGLDPGRLGAQLWGYSDGGKLTSLCYSGANLVPVAATSSAVTAFAGRARMQGRRCSSIVGPRRPSRNCGGCSRRTGAAHARSGRRSRCWPSPARRWCRRIRWCARSSRVSLTSCFPRAWTCSPRRWGCRRSAWTAGPRTGRGSWS